MNTDSTYMCQKLRKGNSISKADMDVSNFDVFNDGTTLVIINNGKENRFTERGIADLYKIVKSNSDILRNACVLDKAVGKAAAALMMAWQSSGVMASSGCAPMMGAM